MPASTPTRSSSTPANSLAPLVVDLGSSTLRLAFASSSAPRIQITPNLIARSSKRQPTLLGSAIDRAPDLSGLALRAPLYRGHLVEWTAAKALLDAAIAQALQAEGSSNTNVAGPLEGRTVVLVEPYFAFPQEQQGLDGLFFKTYGVAALWRTSAAVLASHAPIYQADPPASTNNVRRKTVRPFTRPECVLVVDVGHSGVHAVPVVGDAVQWGAVRRLDVTGRMLTNLLKETLSFRQWDMMDETILVQRIKESCCFVAVRAGNKGDHITGVEPKQWSYAACTELCRVRTHRTNPLAQEYVLPDYSHMSKVSASTVQSDAARYGFLIRGPGSASAFESARQQYAKRRRVDARHSISTATEATPDATIEDEANLVDVSLIAPQAAFMSDNNADDDNESDSDSPGATRLSRLPSASKEQGDTQTLLLAQERFQIPEVLFAPSTIGLNQAPLHEVVASAIGACADEVQRAVLWSNIVLIGGASQMRGLKDRLLNELSSLSPSGVQPHIWAGDASTAIRGGSSLAAAHPGSHEGRVVRTHLVSRSEWLKGGHDVCRERFKSWDTTSVTGNAATRYLR